MMVVRGDGFPEMARSPRPLAPKFPSKGGPRKSNTGTPAPSEDGVYVPTLADRLSYADTPRPFKSPYFVSRLPQRTATSSSSSFIRKNAKQILLLERERLSGGDGFLSAAHVAAKARGEVIDVGKKKKGVKTKGSLGNLMKGKMKKDLEALGGVGGAGGGAEATPGGSELPSAENTPGPEDDDDGDGEDGDTDAGDGMQVDGEEGKDDNGPRKEIITYLTPTAPPSLLPAKKYCDITGLHASYTDPRTKLRYKGLDVWHVVRGLGPGGDQAYLSLRGAQTSLK
ncbi:hypothetical protein IAT38_002749 [Cryptococcus sp. DSM 104549]